MKFILMRVTGSHPKFFLDRPLEDCDLDHHMHHVRDALVYRVIPNRVQTIHI